MAVVGLAVLAGGCGVDPVGAEPLPTPTPSCTPDGSSEPCTWERAAEQAEAAAAFAEAEHAYREFTKAAEAVLREGGSESASPEMDRHAKGALLDEYEKLVQKSKAEGLAITEGVEIRDVRLLEYTPTELQMLACEDGSENEIINSDGEVVANGSKGSVVVVATKGDGVWRVSDGWPSEQEVCSK